MNYTIARRLVHDIPALVAPLALGKHYAVVSDVNTHAVLGGYIEQALPGSLSICLPYGVRPDEETAQQIEQACAGVDAIVAVGSGTINDLCKYAAFRLDKPYIVFGTAPSMNGYTSANAAITVHGHKKH